MITTDSAVDAQIEAPVYGVLYLIELAFQSGTYRITNYPTDVTALSQTWIGLGTVLSVGDLKESEDGRSHKIDVALSQVPLSHLALALGNVHDYQGRSAKIYVAVMDQSFRIVGSPILRFGGFMDMVRIDREEQVGKVIMVCQSGAYDVRSNPAGLRMNDAQHRARHPGERGFEYLAGLVGRPQSWLSARFQQI